jgi:ectoine hydroxylase-related dioxygenase (phytanoyl-CoA dioxygenase family)
MGPSDWGRLIYSYPKDSDVPWDIASKNWHWHGNPLRNVDRTRELACFFFLTKVEPEGGGTLVVDGSHHVVCKYMSELTPEQLERKPKVTRTGIYRYDPWLTELASGKPSGNPGHFMDDYIDIHGFPLKIVELTGEPGDAYIANSALLHSSSMNCSDRPRFMRTVDVRSP